MITPVKENEKERNFSVIFVSFLNPFFKSIFQSIFSLWYYYGTHILNLLCFFPYIFFFSGPHDHTKWLNKGQQKQKWFLKCLFDRYFQNIYTFLNLVTEKCHHVFKTYIPLIGYLKSSSIITSRSYSYSQYPVA